MKKDNTMREILEMKAKIGGKGKKKNLSQARSLAAAIAYKKASEK